MECPHCLQHFHAYFVEQPFTDKTQESLQDTDGRWYYRWTVCPACERATLVIKTIRTSTPKATDSTREIQGWPKGVARSPLPPEIPEELANDYREACLVLSDSPKASAALSRRCLQHLLREKAKVKTSDLSNEIDEILASHQLPSDLADAIDAIRNIGNFAAHPLKSTNTGLILDVEPGEAEWLLDVLESLFDFYFVRPAALAGKRAALNKKLTEAGKPPTK
jgi:Domain of unknown function (DUF4145)